MRRFYKEVTRRPREGGGRCGVLAPDSPTGPRLREGDEWEILLDGRPVRTPMRAALALPNAALAEAVAGEWRAQGEQIDPRAMPLTGLANAAIDHVSPDREAFASGLAAYAESDLLCYRAGEDQADLAGRQKELWGPILDWARARYDVSFAVVSGIIHQPQPPETLARLREAVLARDAFALAAFSPIVTVSGSLVIALAVAERALDPAAAFDAAHLDELWQAQQWGEDALAVQTREAHRADFMAGVRLLELLGLEPSA